ncbi:hypothetical protein DERP_007962 [Dermatophagoides pteronyssinus]|uniref:MTHFR SAM-binding regulatory domain-containing protein n=1 Tax=Dermatophagoides pteronyssinus TaxID=6956 RepID=A0ABQ8IT67_DERPT|nr:hypothetical protein DERP_007962 [Dermatophagoides pteronyssinus]
MKTINRKYVSLADRIRERSIKQQQYDRFFSVEFFPARTVQGAKNWIKLVENYSDGDPLYCDITWHSAGNPDSNAPTSSLMMANVALNYCQLETMLHITCIDLTSEQLNQYLQRAKHYGIRNIMALRGDRHDDDHQTDNHQFQYAADLVQYIRHHYGEYFTIVVAGYPIPHPESRDKQHDRQCLKKKVSIGADYIITQLFFQCEDYVEFVNECRQIGINVPIIPGICAINSFESLVKFSKLSAVPIPSELFDRLEQVRSDQQAVQQLGINYLTNLCRQLLATNLFPGIHFYTLNQSSIIQVIKNCGLWGKCSIIPWRQSQHYQRINESIRPIFWSNRPKSYIHRTRKWTQFPTTNWSTEFSSNLDSNLTDFPQYLNFNLSPDTKKRLSECENLQQLYAIFDDFYSSTINQSTTKTTINLDRNNNDIDQNSTRQSLRRLSLPWINVVNDQYIESLYQKYGQFISKGLMVTNYLPAINDKSIRLTNWSSTEQEQHQQQLPLVIAWLRLSNTDQLRQRRRPVYIADMKTFDVWLNETYSLWNELINETPTLIINGSINEQNETNNNNKKVLAHVRNELILVCMIDNRYGHSSSSSSSSFSQLFAHIFSQ